jgi:hypothetical protein
MNSFISLLVLSQKKGSILMGPWGLVTNLTIN